MVRVAFYLNLQGAGHCRRFEAIARHLPPEFDLAAVGMDGPPKIADIGRSVERVSVPGYGPRSNNPFVHQQTSREYHDFLVNHGDNIPFTSAMVEFLSQWQPDLVVSDVGLEASILARMCGIPVIYSRQHGNRWDKGHTLAYEWACSLIAPYSVELEQSDTPQWIREKTFYSGGFSRFAGRQKAAVAPSDYSTQKPNILVMTGFGGTQITPPDVVAAAKATPQWQWHFLGARAIDSLFVHSPGMVKDVWPYLCYADLVVANAGHNSTMEIGAAGVPSICIPAARYFDEQHCKAAVLEAMELSVVSEGWPLPDVWPELWQRAIALSPTRWQPLQDVDAPRRAAQHIAEITRKCRRVEAPQAQHQAKQQNGHRTKQKAIAPLPASRPLVTT
ncbi:MAG: glycosyltransferase [Cyanobacteria bacterium P01_D01_bin.1]